MDLIRVLVMRSSGGTLLSVYTQEVYAAFFDDVYLESLQCYYKMDCRRVVVFVKCFNN